MEISAEQEVETIRDAIEQKRIEWVVLRVGGS